MARSLVDEVERGLQRVEEPASYCPLGVLILLAVANEAGLTSVSGVKHLPQNLVWRGCRDVEGMYLYQVHVVRLHPNETASIPFLTV